MDTFAEVKNVIVKVLKPKEGTEINLETRFIEDLKADSMDQFFLMDGFCEAFDLTINDQDAAAIRTVGDVVKYIEAKRK